VVFAECVARQISQLLGLYIIAGRRKGRGAADDDWVWVEVAPRPTSRLPAADVEGVERTPLNLERRRQTAGGAWGLARDASEVRRAFPPLPTPPAQPFDLGVVPRSATNARSWTNSDTVTGQAAVVRPARQGGQRRAARRPVRGRSSRGRRRFRAISAARSLILETHDELGLVIDLDTASAAKAVRTRAKEWNGASAISGPLSGT